MSFLSKLLVIEDHQPQLERLLRIMQQPPAYWGDAAGLPGFEAVGVGSVERAQEEIRHSTQENVPYEAVILDLGLPLTETDAEKEIAHEKHGLALLEELAATGWVIIVLTVYEDAPNILRALRNGATDFFSKRQFTRKDEEQLFCRLVHGIGRHREAAFKERQAKRQIWLAEQERCRDYDKTTKTIGNGVGRIQDSLERLSDQMLHRYALDPHRDAEDPICAEIRTIGQEAHRLQQSVWSQYPGEEDQELEDVDVTKILAEEIADYRPCYFRRNVPLTWQSPPSGGGPCTNTLPGRLRMLIDEMIFGPLFLSPGPQGVRLACQQRGNGDDIDISATSDTQPIPDDIVAAWQNDQYDRAGMDSPWQGLMFLKRLARNTGYGCDLESNAEATTITLHIPAL
jgi:DNA-binding NarL/FixJ family response regulator